MIMKYVMIDGVKPVLFFDGIQHKDFRAIGKVTSAGFVLLEDGQDPQTLDLQSTSLGLGPSSSDAALIKKMIEYQNIGGAL